MKQTCMILAASLALTLLAESPLFARGYGYGGGLGLGWGLGGGTRITTVYDLYREGRIPVPPYFALHPPVYYSYPVPRTYGYSPFPYPGSMKTPDPLGMVEPAIITNPYAPSSSTKSAPTQDQVTQTPAPQIIENPYFEATPKTLPASLSH